MKKLLSVLSVLTISGSAIPTTIAASPYQKEEIKLENNEINYSQTNNLESLIRNKREHYNKNEIYIWYKFLAHNGIQIRISNDTFSDISFKHDTKSKTEFENFLYLLLKDFPFWNGSGIGDNHNFISGEDIWRCVRIISNNYNDILKVYENKNDKNRGIKIISNRDEDWSDYSNKYGAFLDN